MTATVLRDRSTGTRRQVDGKLYFDVTGAAPTQVVYTNSGTALLLWK